MTALLPTIIMLVQASRTCIGSLSDSSRLLPDLNVRQFPSIVYFLEGRLPGADRYFTLSLCSASDSSFQRSWLKHFPVVGICMNDV